MYYVCTGHTEAKFRFVSFLLFLWNFPVRILQPKMTEHGIIYFKPRKLFSQYFNRSKFCPDFVILTQKYFAIGFSLFFLKQKGNQNFVCVRISDKNLISHPKFCLLLTFYPTEFLTKKVTKNELLPQCGLCLKIMLEVTILHEPCHRA